MAFRLLRRKMEIEILKGQHALTPPHSGRIVSIINVTGELGACSQKGVRTYLVFAKNEGGFNVLRVLSDPPVDIRPGTTDGYISFSSLHDPKDPEQEFLDLLLKKLGIKRQAFMTTVMDALASLKC